MVLRPQLLGKGRPIGHGGLGLRGYLERVLNILTVGLKPSPSRATPKWCSFLPPHYSGAACSLENLATPLGI